MAQWTLSVDDKWVKTSIRNRRMLTIWLYLVVLIGLIFYIRTSRVFDYKTWIVVFILASGSICFIWAWLAYWELAIRKTWDIIIVDGVFVCAFGGAKKVKALNFDNDHPLTIESDCDDKNWLITSITGESQNAKLPIAAYPTLMEFVESISGDTQIKKNE